MNEDNVRIFRDGNEVCALIGNNLMEGISGFGETLAEALRNLADEVEIINYAPV